uniref:Peptidase_M13 domain-containing protein n=1 Tax=Syphacia muris TaxID=451379 RepID=A0A0N5AVG9_9BILA
MAYPDFITDDGLLTNYYAEMETFNEADDLLTMNDKIFRWSMWKVLSRLNRAGYQREHFDLPPGLVNAWYQPELNSLTLPLAILGQPFYDAKWPSSLNYGSLGVIAGHELSHGFDDEGVQWDGEGFLTSWMGTNAYNSFKEMAQCIIDEYSGFKPPGMPNLSGEQTQGENIADNGVCSLTGIHAAYRAYKNEANLRVFSRFTHDQLFFIGFAQVWCERNDTKYGTLEHDLTNPHSPSIFRVLGTLQNFPAFANAFNCPSNKAYSPTKHCTVWVSEVSDGTCKTSILI